MSSRTDSELVHAYREGDEGAFETLIARYADTVFRYAARLLGDREAAIDITQDTFVKVWKHLGRFREDQSFKTWLFTIARNSAFDWLRRKKHTPFSALGDEENDFSESLSDTEPLPEILFEGRERAALLEKLLSMLPLATRDILLLHYVDEMTFEEIGRVRGESLNTVKSRHRRALYLLREAALRDAPKQP